MSRPVSGFFSLIQDFWRGEEGASAALTALAIVPVIGMAGFAIDLGHVFYVQRALQASTDASALAAAQDVLEGTAVNAAAVATQYSATTGQLNATSNLTATMASGYPQMVCFASTGILCNTDPNDPSGTPPRNGIRVKQQATVPMYFTRIFGINTMTVEATASASARGGKSKLVDVMIIVDRTGSMNQPDTSGGNPPSCALSGIPNPTRLDCAMAGVRELLLGMAPSGGRVGLMVYPGLTPSTNVNVEYDCNSLTPNSSQIAAYNANPPPVYKIIPYLSDYRTSDQSQGLNAASILVRAVRGDSGCPNGVTAIGNTHFTAAINAAQADLVANGRPNVQKAIILLSDGDPNSNLMGTHQCSTAVAAGAAADAAGTWVYSIAYRAPTTGRPAGCSGDPSNMTACKTMQDIAVADPTKFYSTTAAWVGAGQCTSIQSYTDLILIFRDIGYSLLQPRVVPDSTS
jgi:Flp pilus assembly protein TadG